MYSKQFSDILTTLGWNVRSSSQRRFDYDERKKSHKKSTSKTTANNSQTSYSDDELDDTMTKSCTERKWLFVSIGETVRCTPFKFDGNYVLSEVLIELDLNNKKITVKDAVDSEKLAMQFQERFIDTPVSMEQQMLFNSENINFLGTIKQVKVVDVKNASVCASEKCGVIHANTVIKFDRKPEAKFILSGRCKGENDSISIINPDWDFNSIGVGGLDEEFSKIFRRAFISRLLPADYVQQLGLKHVRGILLYGPPGTGKTLMARQIGKMLNAREPKIVNGPSILDKYVGESEANIRKLFADAEKEFERVGNNSALHIIIFDEIDAICKARGSLAGGSAVQDTVVNQLLSKMDGVEQLNNILVIGMTNRKDLIDEALLRPGRMEVQIEIPLPTEHGRLQIFEIHSKKLRELGVLGPDVDLVELAALSKNFSGAEIEGLVRAAISNAQTEKFDPTKGVTIRREDLESFRVMRTHFLYALQNDITPFFGQHDNHLQEFLINPIVNWGEPMEEVCRDAGLLISSVKEGQSVSKMTMLLYGASHSGKTALAVDLANKTGFTFVRMCSIRSMIGFTESGRCLAIKKIFDDAVKAPSSVIILDDLEHLIDYSSIGPRFSINLVKNLIGMIDTFVPKNKKMLIIGTTEHLHAMRELGLLNAFGKKALRVPTIRRPEEVVRFLEEQSLFDADELLEVERSLSMDKCGNMNIGVKELLMDCSVLQTIEPESRVDKLLALLKASGDEVDY